ncbi:hypothetical protein TruAng_009929 [Truncatella angustata]|nr:hypothetical protein TruAng_009929 [Truncatella angustata]
MKDNSGKKYDKNDFVSIISRAVSTVLGVSTVEINNIADITTFIKLGGDSLAAILVAAECQKGGFMVPAGVFLRIATLREVITKAANLAQLVPKPTLPLQSPPSSFSTSSIVLTKAVSEETDGEGLSSTYSRITATGQETTNMPSFRCDQETITAKSLLDRVNITEWTELQLLLLRETSSDQRLNILTVHESYGSCWDTRQVCNIWTSTILAEPVFQDLSHELDISPEQLMVREVIQVTTETEHQRELHNATNAHGPVCSLTLIHWPLSPPPHSKKLNRSIDVIWRIHHAFIDGYSARVLRGKIRRNLHAGAMSIAAGPSFKEAVRSLQDLREERRESTRRFWDSKREQFTGAVGELRISPQREAKTTDIPSQRSITIQFPENLMAEAVKRTGFTSTVYFAAAWALTLGKFMDADQVCFGLVFSGRDLPIPGAFDVVGPLITILPLFVSVTAEGKDEISVKTFLSRVHHDILELTNVQHSSASDSSDKTFSSIMATQFECDEGEAFREPVPADQNRPDMQSAIPMNLVIEENSRLRVFYSTAHYAEEDMINVGSILQNIMSHLLQDSDERLLVPTILDTSLPQEMEGKLRNWSNCGSIETYDYSKGDDLVTLFENVVARQSRDTAIYHGDTGKLSYQDLDQAAAVVAYELRWIQPNEIVCVYADRSVNWLIAIFGLLKAGGVYAPLDPSAPSAMRQANLLRSGARAVLFPSSSSKEQDDIESLPCRTMAIDDILAAEGNRMQSDGSKNYPRRRIARPDDLAYICFTSGSTGQPKGVKCTHKGLVAFQKDRIVRLGATRGVVIAQIMSPVFDGSIHEIFSALTHGAALRLASPTNQDDPFSHLKHSDSAILTPSIAKVLDPNTYPRLQTVYLVGEAVPQSVSERWSRNHSLYNMYGPTEATCGATIKRLRPCERVTLGRANPSSRIYVLDRNKSFVPPGAVGELYLAGIQVAHGYIDLPELSANRFLNDSVMPESGQKMYKTGDYAYWDSAGEICIIGRKDRQIKLRGYRLDLDDLETRIVKAIPGCGGAAVFRRGDHLIAACQITPTLVDGEVAFDSKTFLGNVLPPYAMPRRIISMAEFPLTVAGKLDYKTIEAMMNTSISDSVGAYQPQKRAMSTTEKMVVDAVCDLMKLDPGISIDQDSDLTTLGGHSILQIQLAGRISCLIKRRFQVRKIIQNPVISRLAFVIDELLRREKADNLAAGNRPRQTLGDTELSPIETQWLSKYQQNLGTSSFNVSHVSTFDSSFDRHQTLVSAWNMVLARHSILRCRFRQTTKTGAIADRFYVTEPPKAQYVDTFDVRAAVNTEFSLETEHPIRVLISKCHMLVCVSHIICDYTTLSRLFEELSAAYVEVINSDKVAWVPSKRYQDTTCWHLEVDQATVTFWRSYLSGVDFLSIPPYIKTLRTSYAGESLLFRFPKSTMSNFAALSQSLHLTPHQIALALVSLALQADNPKKRDLILGSPWLGREEDDMCTIGLFLQPLPIRIRRQSDQHDDDSGEAPVAGFLEAVQKSAQLALSHSIEWHSLMNVLSSSDDVRLQAAAATTIPNHPLFDAMVTFHELSTAGQPPLKAAIPGIEPVVSWTEGAKFGIMFEFSAVGSSSLTLRIEYDTSLFSSNEVQRFAARIDCGLEFLCRSPLSTSLGQLEHEILISDIGFDNQEDAGGVITRGGIELVEFGTPLSALT